MNKKLILLLFVVLSTVGCKTFGMTIHKAIDNFCRTVECGNFNAAQGSVDWLLKSGLYSRTGTTYKKILNAILAHDRNRTLTLSAQPDEALVKGFTERIEQLDAENQALRDRLVVVEQNAGDQVQIESNRASRLTQSASSCDYPVQIAGLQKQLAVADRARFEAERIGRETEARVQSELEQVRNRSIDEFQFRLHGERAQYQEQLSRLQEQLMAAEQEIEALRRCFLFSPC